MLTEPLNPAQKNTNPAGMERFCIFVQGKALLVDLSTHRRARNGAIDFLVEPSLSMRPSCARDKGKARYDGKHGVLARH